MGPGGWQGLAQQQDGEQQQQQQAKDRRWDQWVVLNDPGGVVGQCLGWDPGVSVCPDV